jgi:hypothetical protein
MVGLNWCYGATSNVEYMTRDELPWTDSKNVSLALAVLLLVP